MGITSQVRVGSPKFLTGLTAETPMTETEIRTWIFRQMPAEMRAYDNPGVHFAYLVEIFDRTALETLIGDGLRTLASATTDRNYLNHMRVFEYALDNGLGQPAYKEAHILTYRLGIITIYKNDAETQLRVLAFLDKLDAHSSD